MARLNENVQYVFAILETIPIVKERYPMMRVSSSADQVIQYDMIIMKFGPSQDFTSPRYAIKVRKIRKYGKLIEEIANVEFDYVPDVNDLDELLTFDVHTIHIGT